MTAAAVGDTDRTLRLAELGAGHRPLDEGAQSLLVSILRGTATSITASSRRAAFGCGDWPADLASGADLDE